MDEVDLKDIIREYLDGNFEISNTKMLVILALKAPEMCMLYLDEILQSGEFAGSYELLTSILFKQFFLYWTI